MHSEIVFFFGFLLFILLLILFDLGIFSRKQHVVSFRESLFWTAIWVSLALGFYAALRYYGHLIHNPGSTEEIQVLVERFNHHIDITGMSFEQAKTLYNKNLSLEYLTGYIIEYSLSVDNVFVILLIFISFGVEPVYYKKVLFWGILGAIVMRFILIFTLSALVYRFAWILYLFGIFLIIIAGKMMLDFLKKKKEKINVDKHPVVRFMSQYFSVYPRYVNGKFWLMENGKLFFTPLFLVVMVIEFSDLVFAVDSVPAIFSVTRDPNIVFFSNVFAIIGLRSLFFLVSSIMDRFHLIKFGLSVLLAFVGVKMLVHWPDSTSTSLAIILSILGLSIVFSLVFPKKG